MSSLGLVVSATAASVPSSKVISAEETGGSAIVVDPDQQLRPISEDLFGFNSAAFFLPVTAPQDQGPYDAINDEFNPKLVQAVKQVRPASIRYPGGTVANSFNWKNAIGPQSERECWWIPFYTAPASSAYGPDEHMRFVEAVGADANLVVNSNSMTPQDAADWVEYMNATVGANPNGGKDWAAERAANGHAEPYGVTWWEIGNELAGNPSWLRGLPRADRADKYALGGTSSFTNQRLGTGCTRQADDSRGDGSADQQFTVYYPPVEPDSLSLKVGETVWTETDDLSAAGPNDLVYALDNSTGEVTFGDGDHGAIPADGAEIRVSYTSGPHAGFVDFYDAMKDVDPAIEVCWGTAAMDYRALGDNPVDCVQDHPYSGDPPEVVDGVEDWHDAMMRRADVRAARVERHQDALQEAHPGAGLALTEYGIYHTLPGRSDADPTPGYLHSLDQGLFVASSLVDYIGAGVPLAQHHQLYNYDPDNVPLGAKEGRFNSFTAFGYHPTYLTQAPGYVMELFGHMVGTEQVATDVLNGPERVPANPDLVSYPALKTVASTDESGRLTLIVVNRDPEQDISASVLPKRYLYCDDVEVWSVTGDSVGSVNTPEEPDAVGLTKQTVEVEQSGFDYTFPAHSVTAIRLTRAADVPVTTEVEIAPSVISADAGQTVDAVATISNPGDRVAAGELSVRAPGGWAVAMQDWYVVPPGETRDVSLTISVPADTPTGSYKVAIVARQRGQIADVSSSRASIIPGGSWPTVFADSFDDDPVGQPPPGWNVPAQPPDAFVVQPSESGTGNILAVQRSEVGHSPIDGLRPFGPAAGDVRLSYQTKTSQPITGGFAVWLQDASGGRVATVSMSHDVFVYTDGSRAVFTNVSYMPDTWYDVDIVLDASAGTYDVYVDGRQIANNASIVAGVGPPAAVKVRIGANQSAISSFALDDISVSAAESGS